MRRILAAVVLSAISMVASASASCPWLTPGSAAAILGGDVTSAVQATDVAAGSCHFSRLHNSAQYELNIYVAQNDLWTCPAASDKLVGIGTGAVQCGVTRSSADVMEQIDGQVRDLHFTITLSTKGTTLSTAQRQAQREALRRAAEQIAGNLF